jgi:hypothetical protein
MRIAYEDVILKPPEVVFPWIAEPEKAMKWQKDVKGGEIVINTPEVIGTAFTEVIEEDGNQLEMNGTITKYVANKIIGFHLESKIHELDVCYALEELDKKTKFKIDVVIRWKFPMNLISLVIGKRIKASLVKKLGSETLALKKLCEEQ